MVISYWSSIDTMFLSPTVAEILSVIVWITIFPLKTHWKPILGILEGRIGNYAIFSNLSLELPRGIVRTINCRNRLKSVVRAVFGSFH